MTKTWYITVLENHFKRVVYKPCLTAAIATQTLAEMKEKYKNTPAIPAVGDTPAVPAKTYTFFRDQQ